MIPRRFLWFLDLLVLGLAFLCASPLVPILQRLFAPGGVLSYPWIESIFSPAPPGSRLPPPTDLLWLLFAMVPIAILLSEMLGAYRPLSKQSRARIVTNSLLAPLAGLSLIALIIFALKTVAWSRLYVFTFTGLGGIGLSVYRLTLRSYLLRRQAAGYYARNILLIGSQQDLQRVTEHLREHISPVEYQLMGYLSLHPEASRISSLHSESVPSAEDHEHLPCLGDVHDLGELLIHQPVHDVIVVQPASGGDWIQQVIRNCDYFRVTLRIVPATLLKGESADYRRFYLRDRFKLPAVVIGAHQYSAEALFLKRIIDVVVSAVLLVLLFPVFVIIGLAIKITTPRLPILYPWKVVGKNGVEFTGYKFTTMMADADERKTELLSLNIMDGPVFKMEEDPRVTRLGRFLRKYSLNELPQLWSVLKGDMSLVGPRPAFRHELERYEFWHKRKLSIRPGITCLWQVRGRHKIRRFDDWVRMDLEYIDNWSLWLDFKILLQTVWVVLAGTGS